MDPFRIRDFVPDSAAREADYLAASDATRQTMRSQLDIAYGAGARERLDLFFPAVMRDAAPIHLFIHGGYWRAGTKETYAFVADTITAAGAIAAIVEYELVPRVRLAYQVASVRRAVNWLAAHAASFGGNADRISASGHSAGAMLCFFLAAAGGGETARPAVRPHSVFLASGIYDLAPITTSFLQPELGLTQEEVRTWSPLACGMPIGTAIILAVGERETPPFHEQSLRLARGLADAGVHAERRSLAGLDHMSIVREMGRAETAAGQLLIRTIRAA
jgi:arylformamidase